MKRLFSVLLSCIISWQALANTQDMSTVESTHTDSTLSQLVNQLPTTKLNKMSPLLEKIAETRNDKTRGVLKAMMEGDLYYLKTDKTVVLALKEESLYSITNILTAEALAPVKKSKNILAMKMAT